jgi:hypothetical protein
MIIAGNKTLITIINTRIITKLLFIYFRSKIAGIIVTGVFFVGTSIATGMVSKHFELGISIFG